MSIPLPLYLSYGMDRPHGFYDALKQAQQEWREFWRESQPNPDPHNKLPDFRPPREFYGVREGTASAPIIAATARVSGDSAKGTGKAKTSKAPSLVNAMMQAFGLAKKPVTTEEEEDLSYSIPYTRSNGALMPKPEPK